MRLDYRKTFLIGFGFFASSIAWSLYNSFVPVMLEQRFLLASTLIGVIMTIDNFFGVIFQPLVGMLSDRTHTRIGRRMPWILIGIPLCAIAFIFIPRANTLVAMMAVIIGFNFIMSLWRSPVVALMPDVTPAPLRSKANGVINLMGGIGSIVAFAVGGVLADLNKNLYAPFVMGSTVMLFALVMLLLFVREPDSRPGHEPQEELAAEAAVAQNAEVTQASEGNQPAPAGKGLHAIKNWKPGEKRSLILLLCAIFFWFCGYNAVETFFTLYATNNLGATPGEATGLLTFFSLSFVAFALPAGILAGRIGRRTVILTGLVGITAVFIPMLFIQNLLVLRILLLLGGIFWACTNINSLPMVVEMATKERIGTFTGYYYFFSFSAAIASPILFGFIRDMTQDYATLFVYAIIAFLCALGCVLFVRHGEAEHPVPAASPEL